MKKKPTPQKQIPLFSGDERDEKYCGVIKNNIYTFKMISRKKNDLNNIEQIRKKLRAVSLFFK